MRPTRDQTLMGMAEVLAKRGTCSRAQVGAVFSRDGRVLITGYNGAPKGAAHCNHGCNCMTPEDEADGVEPHIEWCESLKPCTVAIHAEANAVSWAARCGVSLEGSTLHVTMAPCLSCAMLLVNLSLEEIVWKNSYRVTDGIDLLGDQGVRVHCMG